MVNWLADARVLTVSIQATGAVPWHVLLLAYGGELCALVAWRLTPWIARARLAWFKGTGSAGRGALGCQ
jgi:hypothetical protein